LSELNDDSPFARERRDPEGCPCAPRTTRFGAGSIDSGMKFDSDMGWKGLLDVFAAQAAKG